VHEVVKDVFLPHEVLSNSPEKEGGDSTVLGSLVNQRGRKV